ncbi:MAG TPA: hypothetical protein VFE50_23905 [Cyclobacteriaceae bacterium]|nr:hypothetical protein [Cyclobacteriaceae bacterium]
MRAFLFVFCCLCLVSCFETGDCLYTNTDVIKVAFKDLAATAKGKDVKVVKVEVPELVTLYENTTLNTFGLLASPNHTALTYVFTWEDGTTDRLRLAWSYQTIVLSTECGAFNYIGGLEIHESTFGEGNVVIRNDRLLTSVALNIDIYL